jgi:ribosomal protein S18 acetylase RimI-like enzyme
MPQGPKNITLEQISLRPAALPDDEAFLKGLYFTTREEDVAMWGLPEAQAGPLLEMQYTAQKMQYDAQYPDARHEIVLLGETPVGRLLSTRDERELFGIDLAILPEYRSHGIGSVIIKGLMREAQETGKVFGFSVIKTNYKAIKLYQRLGVSFTGETVSHYLLEWQPEQHK